MDNNLSSAEKSARLHKSVMKFCISFMIADVFILLLFFLGLFMDSLYLMAASIGLLSVGLAVLVVFFAKYSKKRRLIEAEAKEEKMR